MREFHISFLIRLFFFSGVAFGVQLLILDYFGKVLFAAMVIEAYVINIILAIIIYFSIYLSRKKFRNQLGFLFLLGSLLKFTTFFLIFNGYYKIDNQIDAQEFFAFFAPYALTLIIEVYSLSKWMTLMDSK